MVVTMTTSSDDSALAADARICIYGLGAVGGFVAARLLAHGFSPTAVVRARTRDAVRAHGLRLEEGGEQRAWPMRVATEAAELGEQDLVFVSVKTTALAEVARGIAPLIGPRTVVVSAMNGVPWWFFAGLDAPAAARDPLRAVDADGALAAAMPAERVVGCVVHLSSAMPEPGLVRHAFGRRFIVGEAVGGAGSRAEAVARLLQRAGCEAEVSPRIQQDVWVKLWGNMTMNPISALTGATADRILDDPYVNRLTSDAMLEASEIGARIGLPIAMTPAERHQITRRLGAFRTSMLQDVEARRPLELDSIVGAVIEIGDRVGVDARNLKALMGLARLQASVLGLYPGAVR